MSERVEAVAEEEVGAEKHDDKNLGENNLDEAAQASATEESVTEESVTEEPVAQAETAAEETEPAESEPAETASENGEPAAEVEPAAATETEPQAEATDAQPTAGQDDVQATPSQDSTPDSAENSENTPDPASDQATDSQSDKKIVRTLAVGEQITGTVKRIADFGAFVDIGVGRDGLIHISELSVRRVGKVTDVLQEGQEVTAWIKKLDRDRNRISLTLIDPDTKTIRDLQKGDIVKGKVTRLLPYGAFVDIGIGRDALLHVREMAEGFVAKPEDVVQVDEELEARIIELSRRRSRVDLSLKGLRPEPEAAIPPQAEAEVAQADAEEVEDTFEDVEVLSPMELAFKRAMEAEGMDVQPKKRGKRNRRRLTGRDIQDEIISRTLDDRDR